ncbi:PAS domain S-box protein [Polyangium jinanense]|uniref:PAS domain S-box protein n=1 Tax=Polyangium jinanense TaxID=2829994 RepID=A0A9X3XAT5_9BACT|nr:PAS domain S-box protein [Polyangium jinanense]MDC3957592.1 PAS domain S-box protein [Polyangium jinanense]MDC3984626.1 PAS domain S-box protein [Polyangium jinanense]
MGTDDRDDGRRDWPPPSAGPPSDAGLREAVTMLRRLRAGDLVFPSRERVGLVGEILREIEALGSKVLSERKSEDERIATLTNVVVQLAALNFEARASISPAHDKLDGIAAGLNMLREELQSSTVSRTYLDSVFASMADALVVVDAAGLVRTVNRATTELLGFSERELLGKPVSTLFLEEHDPAQILALHGHEMQCLTKSGAVIEASVSTSPLQNGSTIEGFVCVLRDITDRKRAEEERMRLEEAIRAKNDLIRTMSTPLIPITDDIVVMPLVGTLDQERADQVIESLLRGIAKAQPRVAILDITAVPVVDADVAGALVRAAHAARMLGVDVVLTGLRAEVAKTLVDMGLDLPGVRTCSTLKSGIALSMNRKAQKAEAPRRSS